MKYYTFRRSSNKFTDILSDPTLKKIITSKVKWSKHLCIGMSEEVGDEILGYIVLKYGEDIVTSVPKDFSPIPGKDYMPKHAK